MSERKGFYTVPGPKVHLEWQFIALLQYYNTNTNGNLCGRHIANASVNSTVASSC